MWLWEKGGCGGGGGDCDCGGWGGLGLWLVGVGVEKWGVWGGRFMKMLGGDQIVGERVSGSGQV